MSIDYRLKKAEGYCQNQQSKPKLNMDLVKEQAYKLIAKEHGLSVKKLKDKLNDKEIEQTLNVLKEICEK